jgi:quercetin dioxygenase-like cupin family protein
MKIIQIILFFFALISFTSNAIDSDDFCVANLFLSSDTPSGYPCKSEKFVTANDFAYSSLAAAGSTENPFKVGLTSVNVSNLPGLNGLSLSAARIDIGINGSVPMHTHPDATELLIVVHGQFTVGFITPTKLLVKTLNPGDVWVFPKGLLHFQVNSGAGNAIAYAAFSSSNPSIHVTSALLFGNNLPTSTIQKTTLLDAAQIRKLKDVFGGSG